MKRMWQSWKSGKINATIGVAAALAAFLIFSFQIAEAQVVDRSTMTNKVMAGYQGWFACPGDGNDPVMGWGHWSGSTEIGPGFYRTEIWPDVAEYDAPDLFYVPNTVLTYGGTPYLFSSFRQGAVNTHFRWMQENGVDGAFLQRFIIECVNPSSPSQIHRDTVLQNVMNASTTYGRTFAVEYDISGGNDMWLYSDLTSDWTYLKNTFNIKNHGRYLYHNGKPVVVIWGFGFGDRPGTPALAQQILDWFQADGCFVIAGVPGHWRTDPTWSSVYKNFDGITPWTVGGYDSWEGINYYKNNYVVPDLAECNNLGILYMTTAWPRFGWDNMNGYPCGTTWFSSRGGQHLWDQVYAFKSAGVACQFIAMFDEYDEGTAIMKSTDNTPTSGCWLTTEGKGNDWFLRLTNQAGRMQRGEIPVSQTIPINSVTIPDNAQVMSNSIPNTMTAGQQYNVSVTMRNIGETYWNADTFKWGVGGDYDPFYASNRVLMNAGEMVAPNQDTTFTFTMTAPLADGTYRSDWQMVHEKIRWFGQGLSKQIRIGGTDTSAPGTVTNLIATAADRQVTFTWTNPSTADYTGTMIRFKTTGYPTSVTDGTLVCDRTTAPGMNDSYVHTGLTNGVTYYYGVWTYDYAPNYSARVTAGAVPVDITAPGPVQNFVATAGGASNTLTWIKPTDIDLAGIRVVFKTTGYPTSPTDGTVAYVGTGTGFTHAGLTNGTTYYYSAYSFDSVPNYSAGATAAAAPAVGACFADSFPYANGSLAGNNGWTGAATSQIEVANQTVKVNGASGTWEVWRDVSCGPNISGLIWMTAKVQSGIGTGNMWSIWIDDSAGMNLARWYGSGTTARGRIGATSYVTDICNLTGGWDTLKVKINTSANTTEFFFNEVSLGSLDHSVIGAGDSVGKIRLQRLSNDAATGDYVYFDNLWIGDLDSTPPGPVTNFTAAPGNTQNTLSWTNPGDADYAGTMIRFSTIWYPGSPSGGTMCYNGTGTGFNHTGLTNGVTYYYSAFTYDEVPNYSSAVATSSTPTSSACFSDAFPYSDGNLNGNGGWTGSATNQIQVVSQTVKINGGAAAYDAIRTVSCGDPGVGYITTTINIQKGTGENTMWDLYIDDPSGLNLARWYGTGTTARGRIGGTASVTTTQTLTGGWDTLKVQINPTANTSEFFFNGASVGILDHSQTGAGDTIGRLRFQRIDNSGADGNYLYFDNLTINDAAQPPDTTPPAPVTNFNALSGDTQASLGWTNPTDADFAGTKIVFKTTGYPTGPNDGTQVYSGTGTSTTHTGLTNGVTYYYSAFAFDGVPNYSTGASASTVPADVTPPGMVTGFTATSGNAQNNLSWANPGDGDLAGVKIMFKTTGYPTGPTDGTQCYNGTGTSYSHTGLTNGVTYYYCAYAYDEVPNYAAAAQASAAPAAPAFCFQDEFNYNNGALVGQGGWTGNALNTHVEVVNSSVRVWGGSAAKNALKTINCDSSPTGVIWVRMLAYRGEGTATMWNVWINDSSGQNLARWYGSGTTARGRIGASSLVTSVQNLQGNGVWDSLVVKLDPAANTSQFFFNGNDLGVYSHGTQPGNAVGQIKIERENNGGAAGNVMYLDNIRVSPN